MSESNGAQRIPLTERERGLLLPDVQEFQQAAAQFIRAQDRLDRMAQALRPQEGVKLDADALCWLVETEDQPDG